MTVNLHPEIEHDALSGELHHPGLQVLGRERRDEDGEIQPAKAIQPGELSGGDVAVDGDLDQVRLRQRGRRTRDDGNERDRDVPPVWTQIVQQPPHQASVVGFPEDFVVVKGHNDRPGMLLLNTEDTMDTKGTKDTKVRPWMASFDVRSGSFVSVRPASPRL